MAITLNQPYTMATGRS